MKHNIGTITRILGPVIDIQFESHHVPPIYNALEVQLNDKTIILEVALHLGDYTVRAISMESTDGLKRGMKVQDTGNTIMMPVGPETLGRLMNVIGQPIDNLGEIHTKQYLPIHRSPPRG